MTARNMRREFGALAALMAAALVVPGGVVGAATGDEGPPGERASASSTEVVSLDVDRFAEGSILVDDDWVHCADEGETCDLPLGLQQVRYGANGVHIGGVYGGSVECNNDTFGDPINGVVKTCDYFLPSGSGESLSAPTGLLVELAAEPKGLLVYDPEPEFSWIVPSTGLDYDVQTSYRIQVATSVSSLTGGSPDVWDSGTVSSTDSTSVSYGGPGLPTSATLYWRVRTTNAWEGDQIVSDWSEPQEFRTAGQLHSTMPQPIDDLLAEDFSIDGYELQQSRFAPVAHSELSDGTHFYDFGKDAFGVVEFTLGSPVNSSTELVVRLGEKLDSGRIDRSPGAEIRYQERTVVLQPGQSSYRVEPAADERNTRSNAIPIPGEVGVIMPFRYVEFEGPGVDLMQPGRVRQVRVHYPFSSTASAFTSSDGTLNDVWDLSKYSMYATSFAGIYVDGDRERIPYEGDAYINQLSHYYTDREFTLARRSHEYLIQRPTWPTEWPLHSVLMAWEDYMHTGDLESAEAFYDDLEIKTLSMLARDDGLISTTDGRLTSSVLDTLNLSRMEDLVDWPEGERDGYDFVDYNTVVNAFHYRSLVIMHELALALGKTADATQYSQMAADHLSAFNDTFLNTSSRLYVDGEGSAHSSFHANVMPLAFGMVPEPYVEDVVAYVESKGMAGSVYMAQYQLEALALHGAEQHALDMMVNESDRGWVNMMRVGSTITLEAWDQAYKSNLDWNHAWGAAPANIIPRYILGVRPQEPGFASAIIEPLPGRLESMSGTVPTIRGPITVDYTVDGDRYTLAVTTPANVPSTIVHPDSSGSVTTMPGGGTAVIEGIVEFSPESSASSSYESGDWGEAKVVDGVRESVPGSRGWSSDAHASGANTEWIEIALSSEAEVSQVDLYPRNDGDNAGYGFPVDFEIQVASGNCTSWTTVVAESAYPRPEDGGVQRFAIERQSAACVRVVGTELRQNPLDDGQYRMQFAEIVAEDVSAAPATPVTASSSFESGDWGVYRLVDGITDSVDGAMGWSSSDNVGSDHTEWVQINLAADTTLERIDLYPRDDGPNAGFGFPVDFEIQVSNTTCENWTTVVSWDDFPQPSLGAKQGFDLLGHFASCVRVVGTELRPNPHDGGRYRMQFAEIVLNDGDVTLASPISSSSSHEQSGWGEAKAADDIVSSVPESRGWSSASSRTVDHTEWVQFSLDTPSIVSQVDLYPRDDGESAGYGFPVDFEIQLSTGACSDWTTVLTETDYPLPVNGSVQRFVLTPQLANCVRVLGTSLRPNPHDEGQYRMQFAEIDVVTS